MRPLNVAFLLPVVCLAQLLFTTGAWAAPQTFVALTYQVLPGTIGCADVSGFRATVRDQLGYDPFRPVAERQVAVQVARDDLGYEGWIRWTDAAGRAAGDRHLSTRHRECADIVNNLAFALAVQLQLLATLAPAAPPPSAAPEPVVSAAEPPPPVPAPRAIRPLDAPAISTPPPLRRLRLAIGFGPSLAVALATGPTATGRLFASGRGSSLSLELAIDGALPVRQQEAAGAGFSLKRFAAEGAVCGHLRVFAGCGTGAVAHLSARGFDVDAPRTTTGFAVQLGARLVAAHDLGPRAFIAARVEGMVLPYRWSVTLNDTTAWTTPRVAAVVGADLGLRIFQ